MNLKRALWCSWLHTVDAAVTRLDRLLDTPPDPAPWVPEARPVKDEPWQDADRE